MYFCDHKTFSILDALVKEEFHVRLRTLVHANCSILDFNKVSHNPGVCSFDVVANH